MQTRTIILSGQQDDTLVVGVATINGQTDVAVNVKFYNIAPQKQYLLVFCVGEQFYTAPNICVDSEYNFVMSGVDINDPIKICVFDDNNQSIISNNLTFDEIQELEQRISGPIVHSAATTNDEDNQGGSALKAGNEFFDMIAAQFDKMVQDGQECVEVEELIPNSKWSYITTEQDEHNRYILGKIFDADQHTRYVCYGVPAKNVDDNSSVDLEFSQWLPLNPQDEQSSGYYIMYQDAITGKNIKI